MIGKERKLIPIGILLPRALPVSVRMRQEDSQCQGSLPRLHPSRGSAAQPFALACWHLSLRVITIDSNETPPFASLLTISLELLRPRQDGRNNLQENHRELTPTPNRIPLLPPLPK
jgi:hypothetical protein